MANGSKDGIRVVKKVRKGHGSHHGGAWKVAYADFVTAMMAFFLVMWIVGLNTAVKEAIASYFNDPIGFMEGVERGDKPLNLTTPGVLACPDVKPEMRKDSYDLKKRADEERKRLENAKEALEEVVAKCPDLKRVADSIRINIVSQGLRIDLVETRSDLFFDSGSA
ncbi:MAG TPA: flagellar motor protein MotB, partial [Armatimonadota bacterium]|nr:flagellar motor protein MotB [Armatimonadota bacterium]